MEQVIKALRHVPTQSSASRSTALLPSISNSGLHYELCVAGHSLVQPRLWSKSLKLCGMSPVRPQTHAAQAFCPPSQTLCSWAWESPCTTWRLSCLLWTSFAILLAYSSPTTRYTCLQFPCRCVFPPKLLSCQPSRYEVLQNCSHVSCGHPL